MWRFYPKFRNLWGTFLKILFTSTAIPYKNICLRRTVAQSGSAHLWGGWGRWFESSRSDHFVLSSFSGLSARIFSVLQIPISSLAKHSIYFLPMSLLL